MIFCLNDKMAEENECWYMQKNVYERNNYNIIDKIMRSKPAITTHGTFDIIKRYLDDFA